MSCESPLLAVKLGTDPETGKDKIKFISPLSVDYDIIALERRYGVENVLKLPCGSCLSCRTNKSLDWSIRCECEAQYHDASTFVTLTYDDLHYPGELVKSDLQLFIKNLRNLGYKIRYFACGEYGGQTGRAHYHAIIFGYFPTDAKFYCNAPSGEPLYKSQELFSCWKKGNILVEEFHKESAGYVAGYTSKKLLDVKSVQYAKAPPFIIMSTRPGIGYDYFKEHVVDIYKHGGIQLKNGYFSGIPRYCDKVAEQLGYDLIDLREDRSQDARESENSEMQRLGFTHREQLYKHKAQLFKDKLHKKKRKL